MVFSVDQVLASQIKTEEETSWVKPTPHCDSAIGLPSLIHKSGSIQYSKTVQFPKLFSHSSPCFLLDQVLASLIRLRGDLMGEVTPHCGSAVHHPSLIHKSGSTQHSKTVLFPKLFSHSSCFLLDQVFTDQDLLSQADSTLWVSCWSPVSDMHTLLFIVW